MRNFPDGKEYPEMVRLRQHFETRQVADLAATVRSEMARLKQAIKPGLTVGITAGSRGIRNIQETLRLIAEWIRERGASPVLLPAMGSHGGGSEQGQREVLASLGIEEDAVGCPILPCAEARPLGSTGCGWPISLLKTAWSVDLILPVNRIKAHTSFSGPIESGLCKMLAVGLGGPDGAARFHAIGKTSRLSGLLEEVAGTILERMPVAGGLAIIENALEETAHIEAVPADDLIRREKELLVLAKSWMPTLPAERLDGLIVEEMGKNFSGTGMDTNVIGRRRIQGVPEPETPSIRYISVLNLSRASHGNCTGLGLADFTTRRLVDGMDREATYLNNLTTTFVARAFIPMFFETERECVDAMLHCLRNIPRENLRLAVIPNTLRLEECLVSRGLAEEYAASGPFEILSSPAPLRFSPNGDLLDKITVHD